MSIGHSNLLHWSFIQLLLSQQVLIKGYYHTAVIATERLSNSKAKPRFFDKFEGDNNRVVISINQHLMRSFKNFTQLFLVIHMYLLRTIRFSKVKDISSDLFFVLSSCAPPTSNTHTQTYARTHAQTNVHAQSLTDTRKRIHTEKHTHTNTHKYTRPHT